MSDTTPSGRSRTAVIGLGYVGLPTACMFAINGLNVLGIDSNRNVVAELLDGRPRSIEPEIESVLHQALRSGNLSLSTGIESCDNYVIAVPTPVGQDNVPELGYVQSALNSVLRVASPGNLLVLESTVPPGTIERVVLPKVREAGFRPGDDLLIAHCPERVLPGATMRELVENDRIIGGLDEASARRAGELYSKFVKGSFHLTDLTTAEFIKVIENTYRDVNIALANEFAKLADGIQIDVWEAINLANRHPRVNILRPGPGVGGHCIAVDPWFLVLLDESKARLVKTAREVNSGMPSYVVDRLIREVDLQGGHVAMLGLAYRADVADTRESPAVAVHNELRKRRVAVKVHDPVVTERISQVENVGLREAVTGAATLLILTDHISVRTLDPGSIAGLVATRTAFDTRDCLDRKMWAQAGFRVLGLGRTSQHD